METGNVYITINGKEIEIPSSFTFSQVVKLEKCGFSADKLEEKPFESLVELFSVATNCSLDKATNDLDKYFEDGGDFQEIYEKLANAYSNFFTSTTKKKEK